MIFFNKKHKKQQRLIHEKEVTLEVQKHKKKTMNAIKETKEMTDTFNDLMNKNHITFRIYRASHQAVKHGR